MMDTSMENFNKSLVSEPIDFSTSRTLSNIQCQNDKKDAYQKVTLSSTAKENQDDT